MKVFGTHNTKTKNINLKHQVPKMFLDKNNGSFCVNLRLLELLGIAARETAYVLFVEDDEGNIGLVKTMDKEKGIPIYWYKKDSRARMFNSTLSEYIMKKFDLKADVASYHLVFGSLPVSVEDYSVHQIKKAFHWKTRKRDKE